MDKVVDVERVEHDYNAAEVGPLDLGDGGVVELVEVHVKSSEKSASSRALATCGAFMKIYVNMKAFGT